jgi:HTH-like domain/Integrase core domain
VRTAFDASRGLYGSPRVHADVREAGWTVSEKTVADSMRRQGLVARIVKHRRGLTIQDRKAAKFPDLLQRDFTAAAPNNKGGGDITEIPTASGKLHLATVLDLYSRRLLAAATSRHPDAQLACEAIRIAVAVRGGREQIHGVIFHTDYAEPCVKPRNGVLVNAGGVAWLVPRLNDEVLSEAVEGLEPVLGESLHGRRVDRGRGRVDGFSHHVHCCERVERCRGRHVLVAEESHDDRQRDALLVEVHGLGLAQHVAVDALREGGAVGTGGLCGGVHDGCDGVLNVSRDDDHSVDLLH